MFKYFENKEIFPPEIIPYSDFILIGLIDKKLITVADSLRERFGPLTCNDYKWGGAYKYRGFRPRDCKTGAYLSQHRFGRALDLVSKNVTAEEMRIDIMKNETIWRSLGITTIEKNVSWLHFDVRPTDSLEIIRI